MEKLRQYFERRQGKGYPLTVLRDYIKSHGQPDAEAIRKLSKELQLPESTIRGSISFYADLREPTDVARVCKGTSCMLRGATDAEKSLKANGGCREVYCLGYCDRSPAVLTEDTTVVAPYPDASGPDRVPAVRSVGRHTIVTRRIGKGDFSDIEKARGDGAYTMLSKVRNRSREAVIREMEASGERGRGGAGYPTGSKWHSCASVESDIKYVIANGDEGDPGSFIDRVLMEDDPHGILEGMAICGHAVGAKLGIVFVRSEYPKAVERMEKACRDASEAGVLGDFHVTVFPALGSYVCGEETAMLNTIEGFRGEVRLRPPYPAEAGLYGRPTVVNNVETFVNVPWIFEHGAAEYALLGTKASSGTKAICLNHGFERPGVVEVEFGLSLRDLIEKEAGGVQGDQRLEAILVGGPMGSLVTPEQFDVPVCYRAMSQQKIELGHGGIVAIPEGTDFKALLTHLLEFMVDESCGKCVPCRLGSKRALELAHNLQQPGARESFERLTNIMRDASLCAFGKLMPGPMRQIVEKFGDRL